MNYFEQHHDDYLESLKAFLRIPSISTLTDVRQRETEGERIIARAPIETRLA